MLALGGAHEHIDEETFAGNARVERLIAKVPVAMP
jgi:hypothetical protein